MRRDMADGSLPETVYLSTGQVARFDTDFEQTIFLGSDDDGPLFAIDHTDSQASVAQAGLLGEFVDLRDVGWLLDAQEAALLAFARGLAYWNRHHRFCGRCGSATVIEQGGHMRRCSNKDCARMHFPRTDPAVIMLVEDRSNASRPRCLLARNSRFPRRMMSTLAGFVDPLESLEETVEREVFEECGIRVGEVSYQASQPWPFPSSIMLGFRAQALTHDIRIDGVEIEEAYWFEAAQLRRFGEWGDEVGEFCLPRRDSIARYLVESWIREVS